MTKRDAGIWDAILDNPISDNGHRFGCPAREETGECHCDKPYRLQRRVIMSVVVLVLFAAQATAVWWLAVYAPELGKKIAEWFVVGSFAIMGVVLFGMILYGIGTLMQKWFWR